MLLLAAVAFAGCLSDVLGTDRVSPYDIVSDDDYDTWIIELDWSAGERPSQSDINFMEDRMEAVVSKSSVRTTFDDGNLPSRAEWTRSALDSLHNQYQDEETSGRTVTTHVMFVDGQYEQENVLGIAVGHEYVVIFSERIRDACASNPLCFPSDETTVRRAVLVHEMGHILGLVDNGIPMQSDHGDGTGHSDNQNSVMWASAETTGIFGLSNIPTNFDAEDRADLCAAGGKCS